MMYLQRREPSDVLSPTEGFSDRRKQLILSISILTGCGTLVLWMRMYARAVAIRALGKDDLAMFIAWVCTIAYLIFLFMTTRYGLGLRMAQQRPEWLEPGLKWILAIEQIYLIIVYFIKVSILLFYLRLVTSRVSYTIAIKYTIWFLTAFLIVCIIVVFAQCTPLEKYWKPIEYADKGHCINGTVFFYTTCAVNIVADVWTLVLPIKLVWNVKRPRLEKLALFGVFAIGSFACIANCIRLYSVKVFTYSKDPLYDAVPINIWSMIEINLAIICASVPALKGFIGSRRLGKGSRTGGTGGSGYPAGGIGLNSVEIPSPDSDDQKYGYGVGVAARHTSSRSISDSTNTSTRELAPQHGGIAYSREVEVTIEPRDMTQKDMPIQVDVEEGQRFGVRPGGRAL